jgi:hypothetical protein
MRQVIHNQAAAGSAAARAERALDRRVEEYMQEQRAAVLRELEQRDCERNTQRLRRGKDA